MNLSNELARALRNHRYEKAENGVLIPSAGLFVGGSAVTDVNGRDHRVLPNAFSTEGLIYVLGAAFQRAAQITAFYLAPFSGNVAPDATLTGANFTARQTEFTNYTEATRVPWTTPADPIVVANIGNALALATVTNGLDNATIWGFGLMQNQVKSAITGKLIACFKDDRPRDNLRVGDKVNLQYVITAQDVG